MTEERWRAAVGAGLGVAATLGWVAAGTSNAHADADEAEVIINWSNAHQCQAPGALLATPPRPIQREGGRERTLHACTPPCLLAGAVWRGWTHACAEPES